MNVDSSETYISLYSGGGGLDMGFRDACPNAQCVAYVEHEASAAALLVDHVEAELVDAAPIYTDAFTFPAGRFRGLVDWVIGGPPCQPFSTAGKRLGADDARNLWPLTLRLVGEIQPRGCFFENVGAADSLWYIYSEVIPGLRYLGYEVEAGIFSAAEVGAPHNRERIFILAYAAARGNGEWCVSGGRRKQGEAGSNSSQMGNADEQGPQGRNQPVGEGGYERPAWPPGPLGDWASVPERLWPAVKPGFRDPLDGMAGRVAALSRSQELRILGNGVVPQTATRAFNELSKRMNP